MGMVVILAAVLVAVQVLLSLLPLIIAALTVVAAVRLSNRRPSRPAVLQIPPPWPPALAAQPAATVRPIPPVPVAWVLLPVWQWPPRPASGRQLPVIDAEVISEDLGRG